MLLVRLQYVLPGDDQGNKEKREKTRRWGRWGRWRRGDVEKVEETPRGERCVTGTPSFSENLKDN